MKIKKINLKDKIIIQATIIVAISVFMFVLLFMFNIGHTQIKKFSDNYIFVYAIISIAALAIGFLIFTIERYKDIQTMYAKLNKSIQEAKKHRSDTFLLLDTFTCMAYIVDKTKHII